MTMIKVSIVEDNRVARESLTTLLQEAPDIRCVSVHSNGEDALREIPRYRPRVVLMDINLPGMSGIECVTRLKPEIPDTDVLMLTVYADNERIFRSLRAGASGYLLKTTPLPKIVEAIQQLAEGGSPMSAAIARKVVKYFNALPQPPTESVRLTSRDIEILELVSKGYPDKEIADQLKITPGGLRNHLHRIYRKLHVQSRTEAALKYLGK